MFIFKFLNFKDKNCDKNPEKIEPIRCPAPTAINSYCYINREKNGKIQRGCSINTNHQRKCYESIDSDCSLCIPNEVKICNGPRIKTSQSQSGSNTSASLLKLDLHKNLIIFVLGLISLGYKKFL